MAAAFSPPRPFLRAVCAFDGCMELAVSRCECCDAESPFCEYHGSPAGIDSKFSAACWKCGGFNADVADI
jgi:hypothetical protein